MDKMTPSASNEVIITNGGTTILNKMYVPSKPQRIL
jgi:hypothetical protein